MRVVKHLTKDIINTFRGEIFIYITKETNFKYNKNKLINISPDKLEILEETENNYKILVIPKDTRIEQLKSFVENYNYIDIIISFCPKDYESLFWLYKEYYIIDTIMLFKDIDSALNFSFLKKSKNGQVSFLIDKDHDHLVSLYIPEEIFSTNRSHTLERLQSEIIYNEFIDVFNKRFNKIYPQLFSDTSRYINSNSSYACMDFFKKGLVEIFLNLENGELDLFYYFDKAISSKRTIKGIIRIKYLSWKESIENIGTYLTRAGFKI